LYDKLLLKIFPSFSKLKVINCLPCYGCPCGSHCLSCYNRLCGSHLRVWLTLPAVLQSTGLN